MYPKDKKTAAMMSETIREVLADEDMMKAIMDNSTKKPIYWDMLPKKDGITAIVVAQMLKAMSGDTSAFTALSRFGFGEKVQMEVSDFYRANKIDIEVVNPEALDEGEVVDTGEIGKRAFDAIANNMEGIDDNSGTSTESEGTVAQLEAGPEAATSDGD